MVCLPCILLPLALAIYLKFIQPIVYRLLPQRWVEFLDTYLYPTCPIQLPPTNEETEEKEKVGESSCCTEQTVEFKKNN